MTTLCFVDIETTGLEPGRHQPWEVAVIIRKLDDDGCALTDDAENEHSWQLPVDLERADPVALSVGRYYERVSRDETMKVDEFAKQFAWMTHGAYLVGAAPSFDARMLAVTLQLHGACPGWHHRLICVEIYFAGAHGTLPSGLRHCAEYFGLDTAAAHTAMGDARLARDVFDGVRNEHRLDVENETRLAQRASQ